MSFGFSVGDFVAASQIIASVVAAISSATFIGQYKPHNSTASDQQPRFEELSRNLGLALDIIADISRIEDGKVPRLRQTMRTVMEPMRQLQEELAREGFSGISWKHIEVTIPLLVRTQHLSHTDTCTNIAYSLPTESRLPPANRRPAALALPRGVHCIHIRHRKPSKSA
jgi:hypothetical protein